MKVIHKIVLAAAVFFAACFTLYAEDDDWFWNHQVAEVDFEGLSNVKKSSLSGVVSSFIDKPFTEELYTNILDRLYALDYFEDIVPYVKHARNPEKILLIFQVEERPVVSKIEFSGNKEIRNGELRDKVNVKVSDVYIESLVLFDERAIRDYYISKGYTDVRVSHSTSKNDNGDVTITFNITEGSSTVISKIGFEGISIVSERSLKSKLSLKEAGLFKDGAFESAKLEADKQVILSFYQEMGYIDAHIEDVVINREFNADKNRDELNIKFYISEGAQYIFTGCYIDGNEVFDSNRLYSFIKLKEGEVYNNTKFQEAITGITSLYLENGYMSLDFRPVPQKDSERHEISYYIYIAENTRSHIENITVKGNTKTKDYVILREIPIESGDVFSRESILNGLRNLYNTQFFSNIIPEYSQGSEPNLVDMVFAVEEKSTNNIQFGLTFTGTALQQSGSDLIIPFSIFAKLENSNLFGEGRSLSSGVTFATNEQSIDFTYGQNWIGNLPIQFNSSLALSHKSDSALRWTLLPDGNFSGEDYFMTIDGYALTFSNSIGRRWTPNFAIFTLTGGVSNSINNNGYDESLFLPVDPQYSQFANRWGISNSIWTSFSIDGRDINFDPNKGWFASQRVAWYGFMPKLESEFYLSTDTKAEAYLTLFDFPVTEDWSFKAVFAAYSGISGLFPVSQFLSDSNKLYIDGMFNGRGWTNMTAGRFRGKGLWSNKFEIRVPIAPGIFGAGIFFDAIAIKDTPQEIFTSLALDDFYFSFGPAARFLIPQFPIQLLFAWKFRAQNGKITFENSTQPQFVLSFNLVNK